MTSSLWIGLYKTGCDYLANDQRILRRLSLLSLLLSFFLGRIVLLPPPHLPPFPLPLFWPLASRSAAFLQTPAPAEDLHRVSPPSKSSIGCATGSLQFPPACQHRCTLSRDGEKASSAPIIIYEGVEAAESSQWSHLSCLRDKVSMEPANWRSLSS